MKGAVENDRERAFPALFARAWDSLKPDVRLNRELWFCSGVFGHWLSLKFGMEGWRNVEVNEAAAQEVHLTGTFDGLLMFAAAGVYVSEEALENLFPHLNEKAPVVAFGAKLSNSRFGKILNPFLRMLFNLNFSTTPRPDNEPWHG